MKKSKGKTVSMPQQEQESPLQLDDPDYAEELLAAAQGAALMLRAIEENPPKSLESILGGIGEVLAAVSNRFDAYRFGGLGLRYAGDAVSLGKRIELLETQLAELREEEGYTDAR